MGWTATNGRGLTGSSFRRRLPWRPIGAPASNAGELGVTARQVTLHGTDPNPGADLYFRDPRTSRDNEQMAFTPRGAANQALTHDSGGTLGWVRSAAFRPSRVPERPGYHRLPYTGTAWNTTVDTSTYGVFGGPSEYQRP